MVSSRNEGNFDRENQPRVTEGFVLRDAEGRNAQGAGDPKGYNPILSKSKTLKWVKEQDRKELPE
jgi:hypothetical protein